MGASTLTYSYVNVTLHPRNKTQCATRKILNYSLQPLVSPLRHDTVMKSPKGHTSFHLQHWSYPLTLLNLWLDQVLCHTAHNSALQNLAPATPATQCFSSHVPLRTENLCQHFSHIKYSSNTLKRGVEIRVLCNSLVVNEFSQNNIYITYILSLLLFP